MISDKVLNSLNSILDTHEIIHTAKSPQSNEAITTVFPSSIELIQDIVRIAEENSVQLIPTGNGTSLNLQFLNQDSSSLLVSTNRMQRILYYEPDELVLSAEAGATLEQIQQILLPNKQWLALDPPHEARATLGGIVSTNRTLFLRASYGSPRDLLIGMHAVMHKGIFIKGGGRVVKNVAGYDICKLFTNARGTLGVLTDTTFRVQVKPEVCKVMCWEAESLLQASETGMRLYQSLLEGSAFIVTNQLGPVAKLIVLLYGPEVRVEWQKETFSSLAALKHPIELPESSLLALRDGLGLNGCKFSCRLSLLPSELNRFLSNIEDYPGIGITVDCSLGIVWMCTETTNYAGIYQLLEILSPETNIEIIAAPVDFSLDSIRNNTRFRDVNGIHARIKQQLDPLNTFANWKTLV